MFQGWDGSVETPRQTGCLAGMNCVYLHKNGGMYCKDENNDSSEDSDEDSQEGELTVKKKVVHVYREFNFKSRLP